MKHPLWARQQKAHDGKLLFAATFASQPLQLVSQHIGCGEIVVPGAAYPEMALVSGEFHLGGQGFLWHIRSIAFQSPLVLKTGADGRMAHAVDLQLELLPGRHRP